MTVQELGGFEIGNQFLIKQDQVHLVSSLNAIKSQSVSKTVRALILACHMLKMLVLYSIEL